MSRVIHPSPRALGPTGRNLVIALLVIAVAAFGAGTAEAQSYAGLVVTANGQTQTYCVAIGAYTTGYTLLADSGASLIYDATPEYGAEICEINGTGCDYPSEPCYCSSDYWSYWLLSGGSWTYSSTGATCTPVADGDVQGWAWGTDSPPPVYSFSQICGTDDAKAKAPRARSLERRPQRPHGLPPSAPKKKD